jgi:hypothetical protein
MDTNGRSDSNNQTCQMVYNTSSTHWRLSMISTVISLRKCTLPVAWSHGNRPAFMMAKAHEATLSLTTNPCHLLSHERTLPAYLRTAYESATCSSMEDCQGRSPIAIQSRQPGDKYAHTYVHWYRIHVYTSAKIRNPPKHAIIKIAHAEHTLQGRE